MPRIFVQNLPKNTNENELQNRFGAKGEITDIRLNKDRRHAIIGYKEKSSAEEAINYFNKTFILTNKISVKSSDGTDDSFKKFSKKNKTLEQDQPKEETNPKKEKKNKLKEHFEELKDDPDFDEFIRLQRNVDSGSGKQIWGNDMDINEKAIGGDSDADNESQSDDQNSDTETKKFEKSPKKGDNKVVPKVLHEFTLKMTGLPYKAKKRQIKEFFEPLKLLSLRMPPKAKGFAFVSFHSMTDLTEAMIKHRGFLDGHRIELIRHITKKPNEESEPKSAPKEPKWKNALPAEEPIGESGRIYVRNLSYTTNEDELKALFEKYGPLTEFYLPIDSQTKKQKGFAFVTFVFPEHAVKASAELDKTDFQGRLLHLIAAKPKPESAVHPSAKDQKSSFKKGKHLEKKNEAQSSHQWNTLFISSNAIADIMAQKFNIKKSELLTGNKTKDSIAVRMALGETQIVNEMRRFLLENGVHLKSFGDTRTPRSKTVILVKNLAADTKPDEIRQLFEKFGLVLRVILPPNGVTAVVEMQETNEAKKAFEKLAYNNFKHSPLYLEWAPNDVLRDEKPSKEQIDREIEELKSLEKANENQKNGTKGEEESDNKNADSFEEEPEEDTTLFVKNLNFETREDDLREHFAKCGQIYSATIAYKKSPSDRSLSLSMGYGFVQFMHQKSAQKALKQMQHSVLDGHTLELKISNRTTNAKQRESSGRRLDDKQTGTKICVKNIPFEATVEDVKRLFSVFGELKAVRLPKKLAQIGSYRGFGFVDFVTKNDAKKAFDALSHSTHLYGRPLVLEWAKETGDQSDATDVKRVAAKTAQNFQKGPLHKRLKKSDIVNDLESKTSVAYSDD